MDFYQEIITELKEQDFSEGYFAKRKRDLSLKYHLPSLPTNVQILLHCPEKDLELIKAKLLTKPVRTISGVSPVAVMTKPSRCPHGKCTYCPGGIGSVWGDVPQSYSGHEPATLRGIRNHYDAYLQIFNRLEQYVILGHNFDKIEIIVMGGTFPATPLEYQDEFITNLFKALNDFSELFFKKGDFDFPKFKEFFELPCIIKNLERTKRIQQKLLDLKQKDRKRLEEEQRRNELAKVRCVALCLETRPDWGLLKHGQEMLRQGCTRVELGIQSVYDDVLAEVHRGHTTADSIQSIQILRDLGLKVNFHYMPGLPLTDKERDLNGMKKLFSDPDYRPDMIKFYPCMVAPGTVLEQQYLNGKFKPLTTEEASERILAIKKIIPDYCRIQRVQRDVPTKYWRAGVDRTNLRQYLQQKEIFQCRCIRCREPKMKKVNWTRIELKAQEYEAAKGKEWFISVEDLDHDFLLGFVRLRFPSAYLTPEITPETALVRELHVYGTAAAIGEEGDTQHQGLGRKLMQKAEEIAKQNGKNKIVVISGVGVREYYHKLGYHQEGPYLVKTC